MGRLIELASEKHFGCCNSFNLWSKARRLFCSELRPSLFLFSGFCYQPGARLSQHTRRSNICRQAPYFESRDGGSLVTVAIVLVFPKRFWSQHSEMSRANDILAERAVERFSHAHICVFSSPVTKLVPMRIVGT
jgi:hypothetical protein